MTTSERGYAMAALLVGLGIMSIALSVALPVWRTAAQREREAELIFRGEQYAHAIELYSRRTGGYPPSLDALEKGRFIRRLYKDPVSGADFDPVFLGQVIAGQPVQPRPAPGAPQAGGGPGATGPQGPAGATRGGFAAAPIGQPLAQAPGQRGRVGGGPIVGVVSRSTAESLREYNGRGRYSEWAFVATETTQQAGAPTGPQAPGPAGPGAGRGNTPRGGGPGIAPFGPARNSGPRGGTQPVRGPFGPGGTQPPR